MWRPVKHPLASLAFFVGLKPLRKRSDCRLLANQKNTEVMAGKKSLKVRFCEVSASCELHLRDLKGSNSLVLACEDFATSARARG